MCWCLWHSYEIIKTFEYYIASERSIYYLGRSSFFLLVTKSEMKSYPEVIQIVEIRLTA